MKTVAYCILHYGQEWLRHAIRAVKDHVDDVVILYTQSPSHGTQTKAICPDSPSDLYNIVRHAGANVHWYHNPAKYRWEGEHRQYAIELCVRNHGAKRIIVFDHDELWDTQLLEHVLTTADGSDGAGIVHVPFIHFYRSVNWVCRDAAMPTRILFPGNDGKQEAYVDHGRGVINHFGYAQREAIMRYKWLIHGHINELRPNWFQEKFLDFQPGKTYDVHPTNRDYWHPAAFDKHTIEHLIGDHEYFNLEVIR